MRKIFILGGSYLQLDLILEAKKMFFYTIVLDMDKECIGAKWCDEFLHINIADKESVLQKAKEHNIDMILTSATELGNVTACYVGEKLGLNTNSYQCALDTTNKTLMKKILKKHNIKTAKYRVFSSAELVDWDEFPCIVKPSDSSAGRGLSYCTTKEELQEGVKKSFEYSSDGQIIVEEYICAKQYSIESISTNGIHQIIAIDEEHIHPLPHIMEVSHTIPAMLDDDIKKSLEDVAHEILDAFGIVYGASHIELRVRDKEVFVVELASRSGGMRSEMINLAYGVSFSQLLLLSALGMQCEIKPSREGSVVCNFIIDYEAYKRYKELKANLEYKIFEPFKIPDVPADFIAQHIGESMGYYFVLKSDR